MWEAGVEWGWAALQSEAGRTITQWAGVGVSVLAGVMACVGAVFAGYKTTRLSFNGMKAMGGWLGRRLRGAPDPIVERVLAELDLAVRMLYDDKRGAGIQTAHVRIWPWTSERLIEFFEVDGSAAGTEPFGHRLSERDRERICHKARLRKYQLDAELDKCKQDREEEERVAHRELILERLEARESTQAPFTIGRGVLLSPARKAK